MNGILTNDDWHFSNMWGTYIVLFSLKIVKIGITLGNYRERIRSMHTQNPIGKIEEIKAIGIPYLDIENELLSFTKQMCIPINGSGEWFFMENPEIYKLLNYAFELQKSRRTEKDWKKLERIYNPISLIDL